MDAELGEGKGGGAWSRRQPDTEMAGLNVWQAAEMFDHSEIGS